MIARATAVFLGLMGFAAAGAEVFQPKVVIVVMFEPAGGGSATGELRFWREREQLDRTIPLPAALHDVQAKADGSVIAILTGVGNTNAAASIMALGLDPRFDLRRSYWLVAGIAGIDPADWPTGYFPLGKKRPYEKPHPATDFAAGNVYQLDPGLVRWAYELTRDTPLADSDKMRQRRAKYPGQPNAQRPPFVLIGANLASSTYWSGRLLNQWANAWVDYYTDGRANYVTTAMEDSGTLRSLTNLDRAGKVDAKRVLVLRTASDFDMPWPGATTVEALNDDEDGLYPAYLPSLEAAYQVGSRVVHALIADWDRYATALPGAAKK
ncbi:MAG: purine nucleoside permease [Opitutus sp.]|nr:purine nucleoside permease [Opitutus sp.]